jgi:hypothetical protein
VLFRSGVGTSGKIRFLNFAFTLGSTSSIGASGFLITLPATPVNSNFVTGTGQAIDVSANAVYPLMSNCGTSGGVNYLSATVFNASGTYANTTEAVISTKPFTWATGDYLAMNIQYEVA